MSDPQKAAVRLVEAGPWGRVNYAERADGTMEAKVWLEAQSDSISSGLSVLFKRMAETGRIFNKEQFRHLEGEIYEFKKKANRILAFHIENEWYLTHHYPKGKQKCPPKEIARAETIRKEFLEVLKRENKNAGQ